MPAILLGSRVEPTDDIRHFLTGEKHTTLYPGIRGHPASGEAKAAD